MTGNLLHFFQNPPILPETISESLKIAIESECPEVLSILLQYMYKVCCFENAENIKGRIKEILHGGEFILKKTMLKGNQKIDQNHRWIVLKYCPYGGGGCQKFRKIADVVYGCSLRPGICGNIFSCSLKN